MISNQTYLMFLRLLIGWVAVLAVGCAPGAPEQQSSAVQVNLTDAVATGPIIATVAPQEGVTTQDVVVVLLTQESGDRSVHLGTTQMREDFTIVSPPITKPLLDSKAFVTGPAKVVFEIFEPSTLRILKIITVSFQIR